MTTESTCPGCGRINTLEPVAVVPADGPPLYKCSGCDCLTDKKLDDELQDLRARFREHCNDLQLLFGLSDNDRLSLRLLALERAAQRATCPVDPVLVLRALEHIDVLEKRAEALERDE